MITVLLVETVAEVFAQAASSDRGAVTEVLLVALNVLQVIALAWITSGSKRKRKNTRRRRRK